MNLSTFTFTRKALFFAFASISMNCVLAQSNDIKIASPNGQLEVQFSAPIKNIHGLDEGITSYAIRYKGKTLISPSQLDLRLHLPQFGSKSFKFLGASKAREANDTYSIVAGKAKSANDHYLESILSYEDNALPGRKVDLIFRLYDDAVAFRYVIKGQAGEKIALKKEVTTFGLPSDYDCWGYNQGQWAGYHEGEFDKIKASKIRDSNLYSLPLVCKTDVGDTTIAISESEVKDYPVMFLSGRDNGTLGIEVKHPPRFDTPIGTRQAVTISQFTLSETGFKTPWRVVMVADSAKKLPESNLISMLSEPSKITDTSWIKPGKVSWDWWNGSQVNIPNAGMNTATYKAFTDFAHSLGLEYILIDEGWSVGSTIEPNPMADVTKAKPEMDMAEIISYAKSKNVGVWVWLQWEQLDKQMDAALAAYEKWGIKGIKIDFMNRNDQEMVDYYYRLISKAATHHLLVDMHGGLPPTGMNRTYPNLITQEGVMGAEYNKWSRRVTATHNVTLPFTRMILGPIDYTPGGFHHATPEKFAPRWLNPLVQTTRGQALGMYVVFDSPIQMLADSPAAYKKSDGSWEDGVDFIRTVPTTWDETRVLQGDIGEYIVTARRKGNDWYLGAMSNEQARKIVVPLDFLGKQKYAARVWQDGKTISTLKVSNHSYSQANSITLELAPSGGAVAVFNDDQAKK